ncbi:hypothetical protein IAU60_006572 [Kwoniella sp. DSM 27419]
MVTTRSRRSLPVITFIVSSLVLSLLVLPTIASASVIHPSNALTSRHEEDGMDMVGMASGHMHEDGSEEGMMGHTHAVEPELDTTQGAYTTVYPTESTAWSLDVLPTLTAHPHGKPPGGHDHGSHTPAKTVLDDDNIHFWHKFPPTYLDADFKLDNETAIFGEEFDQYWRVDEVISHRGLMIMHVVTYYGAYFGLLPIALALRSAGHPFHYVANAMFVAMALFGWLAGKAYHADQMDRYEGAARAPLSNMLLLVSLALTALDSVELFKRIVAFSKSHDQTWSGFVSTVFDGKQTAEAWSGNRYEMVGLVQADQDEERESRFGSVNRTVFAIGEEDEDEQEEEEQAIPAYQTRAEHQHQQTQQNGTARRPSLLIRQWTPPSRTSTGSDGTLHDSPEELSKGSFNKINSSAQTGAFDNHDHGAAEASVMHRQDHEQNQPIWSRKKNTGVKRAAEVTMTVLRRTQVIVAYVVFISEFVEYTGMCRAGLVNSCAAHYIKGSIFFWYGLLTFARYLGAYADLGWAWNRRPGGLGVSAEMVECGVIFLYGITNTWMERFGSKPGDPYTVKQVQHISIAVMFWFAGLTGMLLESRRVRKVMGSFISAGRRDVHEPPTYAFSYNPLPALVIGVTGLAMAAHHQEYAFQVSIHSLWGILLAGGSLFRFLTYFFLFLRPPVESTLPSRPPTEVLTAFGFASGGIVFMLSNEEIMWAAMRAGWDDMMAFLNFTVALTCMVFCWTVVVMAIKGWAGIRMSRSRVEQLV